MRGVLRILYALISFRKRPSNTRCKRQTVQIFMGLNQFECGTFLERAYRKFKDFRNREEFKDAY